MVVSGKDVVSPGPDLPEDAETEEHLAAVLDYDDKLRTRRKAEREKDGPGSEPT